MIVIPMLGKSSRFTNAGYNLPKYMLPVKDKSVFCWSMSSFENYFTTEEFLFLVKIMSALIFKNGIVNFRHQ